MIIQELTEDSVNLDQLPAEAWSSHLTLERSLRLKNTMCLNATSTYLYFLVVFWSSESCWLHLHRTCSPLLFTKRGWRWTRILRHLDIMEMKLLNNLLATTSSAVAEVYPALGHYVLASARLSLEEMPSKCSHRGCAHISNSSRGPI